ncbi:MAG: histidine kinase [Cyclobacteriaceae bacterium]|nr:histidine kinase [Cyclobacteriaceae bacterium]
MQVGKSYSTQILLHSVVWIFFFLAPLLLSPPGDFAKAFLEPNNLLSLILRNGLLIGLFYFNLFYLAPHVLIKKGALLYAVVAIAIIMVISLINWQIHHHLSEPNGPPLPWEKVDRPPMHSMDREMNHMGGPPPMDMPPGRVKPMMFASPVFSSFLLTTLVIIFSTSLFLWEDWKRTKERAREQEFERQNAELAALKLQISPHFLFNTLNNIRWLVRSKSDRAEDSLVKLSQLLRYILYQTTNETVELGRELEHLSGYIELQKMRLTEADTIDFEVSGIAENKTIVPLLLLPIAENLFKHADFSVGQKNSLKIQIDDHRLLVLSENKCLPKTENPEKENSGIGLQNLQKRLRIHYPDKHVLQIATRNDRFYFQLELLIN